MRSIEQELQVHYRYPVHFTRALFEAGNPTFADSVRCRAQGPSRALFVIDQNVWLHWPRLCGQIQDYCKAHCDSVEIAGEPLIVPGGEAVKNDAQYVEQVRGAIDRLGICRQSYVVAI